MNSFNLTEWALKHKQLVYYFILIIFIGGLYSYLRLGRAEDPDFLIREMLVSVSWPGATARDVEEQVTDKIERKLQETPGLDYINSYSMPGQAVIHVTVRDDAAHFTKVRAIWMEVRNLVNDIKPALPRGINGPYFNDRFDDVFGCVYALTGDGFSYEEMRRKAEDLRRILMRVPSVKKAELIGVQTEKIYITIPTAKLATLGLPPEAVLNALQANNAMTPSGMLETATDNVYLRISGMFETVDDLRQLPIRADGRIFRLGDIAAIARSYSDPADSKMFFNGKPAIGIALSMEIGGNILDLGRNLKKTTAGIEKDLPMGLTLNTVFNQPTFVKGTINEFLRSLGEAVLIVLTVCFLSLGFRSGVVVSLCIPLVIAGVFVAMKLMSIDITKISLGALVIALGLLVDDAIIAGEMMAVKLEQGLDRFQAACAAYRITAFPMLTGTLITCAGFIPVGFAKGSVSQYIGCIFWVVTIALLISWLVAATVTPLLGYRLLKTPGREHVEHFDLYDTRFYRFFKTLLVWCLHHRKSVLIATVACFLGSLVLLGGFVKQEFFPVSNRLELVVDLSLPEGTSRKATEAMAERFARHFTANDSDIANYSYYIGQPGPRFVLTANPIDPNTNYVQFLFVAKDLEAHASLTARVRTLLRDEFPDVRSHVRFIQTGMGKPYPMMIRVSGPDHDRLRTIAEQARDILVQDPHLENVHLDWNEKSKVLRIEVDPDKARLLGVNRNDLADSLQAMLSGQSLAEFREKDRTIDMVFRLDAPSRSDLSRIKDLSVHIGGGRYVPLDQVARISYEAEDGLIWRWNLQPTITLLAHNAPGEGDNDWTHDAFKRLKGLRDTLPAGYSIDIGGTTELSEKTTGYIAQPVPAMLIIIITLLMFQLQNMSKMVMTLLTAPLGIIGVSLGLFLTGRPVGLVVQLGILALSGIIMRNSVILIDQIGKQEAAGESRWNAIINASVLRFRPIMLTAAAAILAMIPLVPNRFWGPMAVALASGILAATILTLIVLPTMYAAWYRVKE